MSPTFDRPTFDSLTTSLCRVPAHTFREQSDTLETLQIVVRRLSHMVGANSPASPNNITTGWASVEWTAGMASLAWLMEHRYLQFDQFEHSKRQKLECLRLRAMVAILWWQGGYPDRLQAFDVRDVGALCHKHTRWLESIGDKAKNLPCLLARGPRLAVQEWVEASHLNSGLLFRRITPNGMMAPRGLSSMGIYSILSALLINTLEVGLVTKSFALKFAQETPMSPTGGLWSQPEPVLPAVNAVSNTDVVIRI